MGELIRVFLILEIVSLTLDSGIVLLLSTHCIDSIHLRKLVIERGVGEHTAGGSLIIAKDHNAQAGLGPYYLGQFGASKTPELCHC